MIIRDELKNWLLTDELAALLIIPIRDMFPNVYRSGKQKNWSDRKIVDYVANLDISKTDYAKIIMVANRCMKIAAFT